MVELVFNLQGYFHQAGIKVLRQSYDTAEVALYTALENAQSDLLAYEKSQHEGAPWEGELDEDGQVIWSHDQLLEETIRAASDALDSLRRSYAISLYHTWERGARSWTGAHRGLGHDKLVKKAIKKGLAIDPHLEVLRLVANVVKHDNDYWGHQLVASAPDLVDGIQITPPNRTDWYEAVVISDGWMRKFFDAVAVSGPDISTPVAP